MAGNSVITTTAKAEEELRELFEQHRLPPPRITLQSQSALTMIVAMANTDLLTMVPIQWTRFEAVSQSLAPIPVKGNVRRALDRHGAPRRTTAHGLL